MTAACRRAALAAAAFAAVVAALLPAGLAAAPSPQLAVSPGHGTATEPFAATYVRGQRCAQNDQVAFEWDVNGPFIGQAPVTDPARCSVQNVTLTPPQNSPASEQPGHHTLLAAVFTNGQLVNGTQAATSYTLDPTEGPTATGTAATPTPVPTPTPTPTPVPTAQPLKPVDATFPPHNCANGVPDGPTACPSTTSGALSLSSTPSGAPPKASTAPTSGTPGTPIGALFIAAGATLLLITAVVVIGWRSGGRRSIREDGVPAAARQMPGYEGPVSGLLDGGDAPPPAGPLGHAPPPPSARPG